MFVKAIRQATAAFVALFGLSFPHTTSYLTVFANSQAGLALEPISGYSLQETIHVATDGSLTTSTTALDAGITYKLRVSGQAAVGGPGFGDAEYAFDQTFSAVIDRCNNLSSGVDLGLGINDQVNSSNKTPFWGARNANHVYHVDFVGQRTPITLNYHDCNYSDNSGAFTVEIFRLATPYVGFASQEVVTVPVNGSVVTTTSPLDKGLSYRVRASGSAVVGGPGLGDAEYFYDQALASAIDRCGDSPTGVDGGLAIDDLANDSAKFPQWGGFASSHVYTVDIIGRGLPINFSYHDCGFSDNSGALSAEIFRPTTLSNGIAQLITFDEFPSGTKIYNHYDGVTFVQGNGFDHPVTLVGDVLEYQTPLHCEFFCPVDLVFSFDVPQYRVRLSAGLGDGLGQDTPNYTLLLLGYSGPPDSTTSKVVARAVAPCLGNDPTLVDTPLQMIDPGGRIRYAQIAVAKCNDPTGPDTIGQILGTLYIDNLVYERPTHPTQSETDPPAISIIQPARAASIQGEIPGDMHVDVTAIITDTAIYSITAQVNGRKPIHLYFERTGDSTFVAKGTLSRFDGLVDGANSLTVQARDFDRPPNLANSTVNFVFRTKPIPPPSPIDIWPTAFEVTQAIDDGPHALGASNYVSPSFRVNIDSAKRITELGALFAFFPIPLFRGKPTLIRVYGAASGTSATVRDVPATMAVYRDNCQLGCQLQSDSFSVAGESKTPLRHGINVSAMGSADSMPINVVSNLSKTWNFLLYPGWTEEDLKLVVKVNNSPSGWDSQRVRECESLEPMTCHLNNTLELHIRFQSMRGG